MALQLYHPINYFLQTRDLNPYLDFLAKHIEQIDADLINQIVYYTSIVAEERQTDARMNLLIPYVGLAFNSNNPAIISTCLQLICVYTPQFIAKENLYSIFAVTTRSGLTVMEQLLRQDHFLLHEVLENFLCLAIDTPTLQFTNHDVVLFYKKFILGADESKPSPLLHLLLQIDQHNPSKCKNNEKIISKVGTYLSSIYAAIANNILTDEDLKKLFILPNETKFKHLLNLSSYSNGRLEIVALCRIASRHYYSCSNEDTNPLSLLIDSLRANQKTSTVLFGPTPIRPMPKILQACPAETYEETKTPAKRIASPSFC